MEKISIAAVQLCSKQDRDKNLAMAHALMVEAVQAGARLIALPENFSFIGDESEKVNAAEDLDTGPSVHFLKSFAAKHKVAIIGGSVPLKTANKSKVTNTCLAFGPSGQITGRYDKLHLFDFHSEDANMITESRYVEPGNRIVTIDVFNLKMGLSICYDLRFPELYRMMALQGAGVLFVPAAFTAQTGKDHWEVLLRARAIENQCYVVAPAQIGRHNADRVSYGRTMIVDPWGQVLMKSQDKEGIIVCEIDLGFLDKVRKRLPALKHIRQDKFFPSTNNA